MLCHVLSKERVYKSKLINFDKCQRKSIFAFLKNILFIIDKSTIISLEWLKARKFPSDSLLCSPGIEIDNKGIYFRR